MNCFGIVGQGRLAACGERGDVTHKYAGGLHWVTGSPRRPLTIEYHKTMQSTFYAYAIRTTASCSMMRLRIVRTTITCIRKLDVWRSYIRILSDSF